MSAYDHFRRAKKCMTVPGLFDLIEAEQQAGAAWLSTNANSIRSCRAEQETNRCSS